MAGPATEMEHLFGVPGNCTLHEVKSRGTAGTVLSVGPLNIYAFSSSVQARVGDVSWRLAKDLPVLKYDDHTYTFALVQRAGVYFCLCLPSDAPQDEVNTLQAVLASLTAFCDATAAPGSATAVPEHIPEEITPVAEGDGLAVVAVQPQGQTPAELNGPPTTTSERVALGLSYGGRLIGQGLVAAAVLAGKGLAKGATYAVNYMQPADQPVKISPEMKARLDRAQEIAKATSDVTSRVADAAGVVALRAASWAAERIVNSDMGRRFSSGADGRERSTALRRVGSASIQAIGEVFDGMTRATQMLMASSTAAATQVIDHRYGNEAAVAAQTGMRSATHVVNAALDVRSLHPAAMMRRTATHTAKGVIVNSRGQVVGTTPNSSIIIEEVASPAQTFAAPAVAEAVSTPGPMVWHDMHAAGVGARALGVPTSAVGVPAQSGMLAGPSEPRYYPAIPQH